MPGAHLDCCFRRRCRSRRRSSFMLSNSSASLVCLRLFFLRYSSSINRTCEPHCLTHLIGINDRSAGSNPSQSTTSRTSHTGQTRGLVRTGFPIWRGVQINCLERRSWSIIDCPGRSCSRDILYSKSGPNIVGCHRQSRDLARGVLKHRALGPMVGSST